MLSNIARIVYKNLLRPILFTFDPDDVHSAFLQIGNILGSNNFSKMIVKAWFFYENKILEQNILNIKFRNPVGLAAGFDKNGNLVNILSDVGFGHEEIGTVTFKEYEGNARPWNTRLIKSRSILVNFGLKNDGVRIIADRIKKTFRKKEIIYGVSVGKTNAKYTTTLDSGIKDYINCLKFLEEQNISDYYTINISCPNMYGGETFTTKSNLDALLIKVSELKTNKPIFLKMPINLPWQEFKELCDLAIKYKINGVIIGNLNKDRNNPEIFDPLSDNMKGNLSGKPTEKLSNELISKTYKSYGKRLLIIGVGGIFSAEDAYKKIKLGASLVQLITGMIFEGPQLIGDINKGLVNLLINDGYKNISEAVGKDVA